MPIHDVGDAMREMKAGSKHIKTRKQAIAVGLAEERREGGRKDREDNEGHPRKHKARDQRDAIKEA